MKFLKDTDGAVMAKDEIVIPNWERLAKSLEQEVIKLEAENSKLVEAIVKIANKL